MVKLYLNTSENFSFKSTVYSHGWSDLKPFKLVEKPFELKYVVNTSRQRATEISISETKGNKLVVSIDIKISDHVKNQIRDMVRRMFRLDEDYQEFYDLVKKSKQFAWVLKYNAGRMLRCGSLWEDMVKMLCTTNCTWRLTQIMTENLVEKLGSVQKRNNKENMIYAFPNPEIIANQTEKYLRNEIKLGYRAPYLLEFARSITKGELNLDDLEDMSVATSDLYKIIHQIKGFGDYAVSNLLKLLGRYDYMGADSWSRQKFYDKHHKGKKVDDKKIFAHYKKYGKWAGLFFWMDVSEDWYKQDIPW